MNTNAAETVTKRQITIVLDGRTAYNVGFSTATGADFRNFVSRGAESDMLSDISKIYPADKCDVTILRTTHRAWLKAAKAARK